MAATFSLLSDYFYFPYIMAVASILAIFVSLPAYSILKGLPERVSGIVRKMDEENLNQNI